MELELLTKKDLQEFREQLIGDLKKLFHLGPKEPEKLWLKSSEVRQLLRISQNTLQSLRMAGKLHPTKLGGILYYSREEIQRLLGG
jgi:hypothetical protein